MAQPHCCIIFGNKICLIKLQLKKANLSDTEPLVLTLTCPYQCHTFIFNLYDKRDGLDFEIVNFAFLGGDVPSAPSIMYIFHSVFILLEYVQM